MSKAVKCVSKAKLNKDFEDFNLQIDKLAEEEMKSIRKKADDVKAGVAKIGETVELSIKEAKAK